jgi:plastocyanin
MASSLRSIAILGLGLLTPLALATCGGDDNGDPPIEPPTTGTIAVTVRADGDPQSGVTVNLFASGSSTVTETQTTSSNGVATFSDLDEGTWDVEVDPPEGFDLDAGEDARKSATVTAGGIATASFDLVDTFEGQEITAGDNLAFSQPNLTISAGTAVRWINGGSMLHTVTPDGHSEWSSADLAPGGASFTHTFNTPGTYDYFCTPHAPGMSGTVTVTS